MNQAPDIKWVFHGTVAVTHYAATLAWLDRFVGCTALEYSDAPAPVARAGGCCWLADGMLEIAEPNAADTPTARFLERFGPGYLNLALQVDDLTAASDWFAKQGAPALTPIEHHFTFTHPKATCGLQFEWADFHDLDWDPRHGSSPPPPSTALIDAPRIAYWGAMVANPDETVNRLQTLCRLRLLNTDAGAPAERPAAVLSLNDGNLALFRLPENDHQAAALWGTQVNRPRFHLMAFRVRDLDQTRAVFAREHIRLLQDDRNSGTLVTHPEDTAGLCLAWTDRDMEGDPRGPLD